MIEKLDPLLFDWLKWINRGISDFNIPCRYVSIIDGKNILIKHTIGYCDGESLLCRPKHNHKAIMFFKDGEHFWFHLRNIEFREIYET